MIDLPLDQLHRTIQFFIALVLLSTPIAALFYFLSGLFGGVRVWEKAPWLRKLKVIPLVSLGGATGVAVVMGVGHGCISMPTQGTVIPSISSSHSLGVVAASAPINIDFNVLYRLRQDDANRGKELKRLAQKATDDFIARYQQQSYTTMIVSGSPGQPMQQTVLGDLVRDKPRTSCHITCYAHHGAQYDRETLEEYCNANWIPPKMEAVPGWWPVQGTNMEMTAAWPGPPTEGFHSYKLYWKEEGK